MVDMVVALPGCVCPYSVCLALPVTGGGRAQCVIGFEGSAALTFWAAGVNRGCTVPKGLARGSLAPDPQGQSVRRCCSVSVYLCCRSSSINFYSFQFKTIIKLVVKYSFCPPPHPPTPHPLPLSQIHLCTPPLSLNSTVHHLHTLAFSFVTWLGFLLLSVQCLPCSIM